MNEEQFESVVAERVSQGWRLESRTPTIAVLAKGKRPNHLLHLILSILTLGLWILVWINVASWGGERRTTIRALEDGQLVEETQRPGALKTWPPKRTYIETTGSSTDKPRSERTTTSQTTSRTTKTHQLIAALVVVVGVVIAVAVEPLSTFAPLLIVVGLIWFLATRIYAWWQYS